jgi:hypothetical protein
MPEHKVWSKDIVSKFLAWCWAHGGGDDFLSRIVTADETWIDHFEARDKTVIFLSRKVLTAVFWDTKGVLLVDTDVGTACCFHTET